MNATATKYGPCTKWAVERRLFREGAPSETYRIGTVRFAGDGYRFVPNVAGRKPSRKSHPTFAACLPRWVGFPDRCETRCL